MCIKTYLLTIRNLIHIAYIFYIYLVFEGMWGEGPVNRKVWSGQCLVLPGFLL